MLDLKQRFEEFGHDEPDHRPIRDRLDAGHRALRRRRAATGAAAMAVIIVVGTGAWALGGGENRAGRDPQYAGEPTTSPASATATIPMPVGTHEQLAEHRGEAVFYDGQTGELRRAAGAEVTRLVSDPIPTDAKKNVALEVDYRGDTLWMYLYWSPDSSGGGSDPAHEGQSFDDWVANLNPDTLQHSFGQASGAAPDQGSGEPR